MLNKHGVIAELQDLDPLAIVFVNGREETPKDAEGMVQIAQDYKVSGQMDSSGCLQITISD